MTSDNPDQSVDNWQLIKDVIWYVGGDYMDDHHKQSIRLITGGGTVYSKEEGFSDGFMGGLELQLFDLLIDDDFDSPYVKCNHGEKLFKFGGSEAVPYGNIFIAALATGWIINPDEATHPYFIWQYDQPLEYWYRSITDKKVRDTLNHRGSSIALRRSLSRIAAYDTSLKPEHNKSLYVEKVRKILNERPIPENMQELWSEAKESVKTKE